MANFNAQNTDAENAKSTPKATDVGGVTLVKQSSAQEIAREDNRDTNDGRREGGENPGASIK
jgi:hypothetical protein